MIYKIWGQSYKEIIILDTGEMYWETDIRKTFRGQGGLSVGLNQKFVDTAIKKNVKRFVINILDIGRTIDVNPREFKGMAEVDHQPSVIYPGTTFDIFRYFI